MRRRGGTKRAIKINKLLRAKNPSKSFYTWEIWEVWRTQSKKKKSFMAVIIGGKISF